ncbi:MAG TPA: glutamine--fructose-6-phosphate transaminase (isomerizing) [Streptosporangiaceae bacterium]|nr:glutamine--fructose-6-phosphate transaminase (isomerizing) [Streptosporangiaceae bacterium]
MCGIVGYAGGRQALDVVLKGLSRLEYRGYDSAGVAVLTDGKISWEKRAGKLGNLTTALAENPPLPGTVGLGHTRWATHGAPTDPNAHPHADCGGHLAVVHNGIIENFADLRAELTARGHIMTSETDTELVAHLLEDEIAGREQVAGSTGHYDGDLAPGTLAAAMRAVCQHLDGTFTLVVVDAREPDVVVGARRNSPLVVGRGDGENFLASDVAAFISFTKKATEIGQDQVAQIRADMVEVTNFDGSPAKVNDFVVDWDAGAAEKAGFTWFMTKEIVEQPRAVAAALTGRLDSGGRLGLDEMRLTDDELRQVDKIVVVACGTAYHAGLIAKYAIEHWSKVPCEVQLASEFRYSDPILTRSTLVIAISQSGETLDTLMAIRHATEQHSRVLSICNVKGSSIPRESDAVVYTHAGPEIAVASTKAFLTQLISCYVVALYLAQAKGSMFPSEIGSVLEQLRAMPKAVEETLERMGPVRDLARELASEPCVLFLGRQVGYPVALEGALKLKELAYMHAEGFAAGELKHGPIALIEPGLPVVVVVPPPRDLPVLHDKVVSNIQEIRARGARTIVLAERGDAKVAPFADTLVELPVVPPLLQPLVATVPLQVFAAELADAKGHDVDQPRNLAKSVTVE